MRVIWIFFFFVLDFILTRRPNVSVVKAEKIPDRVIFHGRDPGKTPSSRGWVQGKTRTGFWGRRRNSTKRRFAYGLGTGRRGRRSRVSGVGGCRARLTTGRPREATSETTGTPSGKRDERAGE